MDKSKVVRHEVFVSRGQGEAADLGTKVREALTNELEWLEVQTTRIDREEKTPCYCVRGMPELWPGGEVVSVILKATDSDSHQAIAELEGRGLEVTRGDDQVDAHKKG